MGRKIKIKKINLAYIAGFLDGDGSLMIQLKKRHDQPKGLRLMFTICFYQDSRHEKPLFWIKKQLGIGYISRRKDGMTELRINGYEQTQKILEQLAPFIKFKAQQVKYILQALSIIRQKKGLFDLTKREKMRIIQIITKSRRINYQSGAKKAEKLKSDLKKILDL